MNAKRSEKLNHRGYGLKGIIAIGIPFLVAGLLMSAGFDRTSLSVAENRPEIAQVSSNATPAMPSSFAELAEKMSPTVVNVKVTKIEKAGFQRPQLPQGHPGNFFGRFFEGMPSMPENPKTKGAGSGVIISETGTVITNNHVIEDATEVTVTLADEKEYKAQIVGRDPKTDLAVLKIEDDGPFPTAVMGNSEQLKIGDWVVAIGNPFGLNHTVTSGIVSAKGRVIGAGPYDDFIQTDASINPGNSGGPLFNVKGEVVGINTAIIPQGQGIGFAIPVNIAKQLIPQLVADGTVTRGYLGVSIQTVTPELAKALGVEKGEGALVADVTADGPAEKSDIQRGDIITAFDGQAVKDSHDLPAIVAATPVDKKVMITVLRDGEERQIPVTVGKLASEPAQLDQSAKAATGQWGLQLNDLSPETAQQFGLETDKGVVVVNVEPGSPAQEAGMRQGDVIVEVNRKSVNSIGEVKETIRQSKDKDHLLLLVQRQNGKFYVPLAQQG